MVRIYIFASLEISPAALRLGISFQTGAPHNSLRLGNTRLCPAWKPQWSQRTFGIGQGISVRCRPVWSRTTLRKILDAKTDRANAVLHSMRATTAGEIWVETLPLKLVQHCSTLAYLHIGQMRLESEFVYADDMSGVDRNSDPADTMVDGILVELATSVGIFKLSELEHVALLFGKTSHDLWQEYIDTRNFTAIHFALLRINQSQETLRELLVSISNFGLVEGDSIDAIDSRGRSAIAWAVEYGWADAVRILLEFGACPNQIRQTCLGSSPLLHLAIAGPAAERYDCGLHEVVVLMIEAGANLNTMDHEGWTAVHVAASWNNLGVLEDFARYAGETLAWDGLTNDKKSATDLSKTVGVDEAVLSILSNHQAVYKSRA